MIVQDMLSKKALLALTVGFVSGFSVVVAQISLATLVFSGPLAPYSSQGIGLVLFGTFAGSLVIAIKSTFTGAVACPPVPTMVVLAAVGGAIAAQGDALFATMVAAIVVCTLALALVAFLIGRFRLANLLRFIPYPVSAGFVAGTGGVACVVALSLVGITFDRQGLIAALEPQVAAAWGTGVAYGVGLYLAAKRWNSFLLLPVSFPGVAVACHLGLAWLGVSAEEAAAAGFLFGGVSEGWLWPAFGTGDIALVDWGALAGQIPNMLTLVLIALLCIVMYVGGLEVAAKRELDWNREFRAVGVGGLFAALGGGPASIIMVPTCMRNLMFGVDTRFTGVVAALVIGSPLLLGGTVLELVPVPLMAGVLIFTGINLIEEWLVKVRRRVPRADYAIIVAMFATIMVFGFFEGVGVGVTVTVALFVVRLSRVDLVASRYTARERRSQRLRPIPDRAVLQLRGERAHAYQLRGYVFFGSAYPLADRLTESLRGDPPPVCILLDFAAVSGYDFSSVNALCRFIDAAAAAGTRVVLSAPPAQLGSELRRNLPAAVVDGISFERDADAGLERCEDILLDDHRSGSGDASPADLLERVAAAVERDLDRQVLFEELVEALADWLDVRDYQPGDVIAGEDASAGFLFMTGGRASIYGDAGNLIRQVAAGDVIEAGALSAGRSSKVVADRPCRTALLTTAALRLLEANDSALALRVYRHLVGAGATQASDAAQDDNLEAREQA